MSSNPGQKHFCKTCSLWISSHPANIAKHEASGTHKANVNKKIREASEDQARSGKESETVKAQLELINRAAEAAMSGRGPTSGHPLNPHFEPTVSKVQKESQWMVCRSEQGRIYYSNKVTGVSQWNKPVELGGVADSVEVQAVVPKFEQAISAIAPPPRPKSSAPPPRPKALADPPRPKPAVAAVGDAKLLSGVMLSSSDAMKQDPSGQPKPLVPKDHDATTGFGEWEEASPREVVEAEVESETSEFETRPLPAREVKRFEFTGRSDDIASFKRPVTKRARRITKESDSD